MYTVIRDTREQNGWWFPEDDECQGTSVQKLDSGDYSIIGAEDIFSIERKATTAEFAMNICEKRFFDELARLEEYNHPFLLLEFSYEDLLNFPHNSTIPKSKWSKLKVKPKFLISKLHEIELNYKTKIIFAPFDGAERAKTLFKYVSKKYGIK